MVLFQDSYNQISVTVPASFQLNQRQDTLLSCQYAGLELQDDDLLDEPTAALIDYIVIKGNESSQKGGKYNSFSKSRGPCLENAQDKGGRNRGIGKIT